MPASTTITRVPYRVTISFILARHCVLSDDQLATDGYKDMPIMSHCAPLLFNPSNTQRNSVLSKPLEICTMTLMEVSTAFTAVYPALTNWAKLPMFTEA